MSRTTAAKPSRNFTQTPENDQRRRLHITLALLTSIPEVLCEEIIVEAEALEVEREDENVGDDLVLELLGELVLNLVVVALCDAKRELETMSGEEDALLGKASCHAVDISRFRLTRRE